MEEGRSLIKTVDSITFSNSESPEFSISITTWILLIYIKYNKYFILCIISWVLSVFIKGDKFF